MDTLSQMVKRREMFAPMRIHALQHHATFEPGKGFHADHTRRQLSKQFKQLIAPHSWPNHNGFAGGIDAVQCEHIFCQIQADHGNDVFRAVFCC